MKVTSTEFQQNVGRYQDAALTEPVIITKNGRDKNVLISAAAFETLVRGRVARRTEDLDEDWWRPAARELRDDRVLVFIEQLAPGPVSFTYLARATTAGTYALPGASVQAMYQPEIGARTAPGTFVVSDK